MTTLRARGAALLLAGMLASSLWAAGCTPTPPPPEPAAQLLAQAAERVQTGRYSAAEALYTQALTVESSNPQPALELAALYLLWRQPQPGLRAAEQALRRGADPETVKRLQIQLLTQARDWPRLKVAAESLLELTPESPVALAALSEATAALGDCAAAQVAAARWLESAPEDAAAQRALGALTADPDLLCAADEGLCAALGAAESAQRDLALAQALIRQEAWALAACRLERIDSADAEAQLWLGEAWVRLGRAREGRAALFHATELDPNLPAAWLLLGKAYLQAGKAEAARRSFINAQRLDPTNPVACLAVAEALAQAGQYSEVEAWNAAALERAPDDVAIWNAVARFYLNRYLTQGDFPQRAVEGALALDPENAEALLLQGILLLDADQAFAALNSLDAALRVDRRLAEAHYWRGRALAALGRPDEADRAYQRARDLGFAP